MRKRRNLCYRVSLLDLKAVGCAYGNQISIFVPYSVKELEVLESNSSGITGLCFAYIKGGETTELIYFVGKVQKDVFWCKQCNRCQCDQCDIEKWAITYDENGEIEDTVPVLSTDNVPGVRRRLYVGVRNTLDLEAQYRGRTGRALKI